MRMLSVVGMKTGKDHRTTIISGSNTSSFSRTFTANLRILKPLTIILITGIFVFLQVKDYAHTALVRQTLSSVFAPVVYVISAPFNWVSSMGKYLASKEVLLAENEHLKLLNDRLVRDRAIHNQIANENLSLREALNVQAGLVDDIITIRISHHVYDGYTTLYYSPASTLADLHKNDAILTTKGFLVGRVISVDGRYTAVMPITDPSSRIPVKFEHSSQQAVIAGDGGQLLRLIHVENPTGVRPGDRLVTSGVGGLLPEGLPVAVVQSTGNIIQCRSLGRIKDQDFVLGLNRSGF